MREWTNIHIREMLQREGNSHGVKKNLIQEINQRITQLCTTCEKLPSISEIQHDLPIELFIFLQIHRRY